MRLFGTLGILIIYCWPSDTLGLSVAVSFLVWNRLEAVLCYCYSPKQNDVVHQREQYQAGSSSGLSAC